MAETTLRHGALTLRPIDPDADAPALHATFGDEAQLIYMLRPACADVAATAALLRGWAEDKASPQWAVVEHGAVCGRVTLVAQRDGVYEIGVQVVPAAQGRGLARRAIVRATAHGLSALGACRVFADIDPDNVPCRRAFERAGYRHEGCLVANHRTPRGVFDAEIYAATAGWAPPSDPTTL